MRVSMNEFKSSRKTAIGFGLAMLPLVLVMSLSLQLTAEDKVSDSFLNYDINADGSLSIKEFNDVDLFSQVDTNQDGVITLTEAKAAASQGVFKGAKLPRPLSTKARATDSPNGRPVSIEEQKSEGQANTPKTSFTKEIRQGPQTIFPNANGIGRHVEIPSLLDVSGTKHESTSWADSPAVVIALTGTGCPLCLKYAPTLAEIENQYNDRGVQFIYVNPNDSESVSRLENAIHQHDFDGPYIHDRDMKLIQSLEARTSTEVFVLDQSGTLCYRGAVDDQYGFGYTLSEPRNNYLKDAIDAVIARRTPEIAATTAPGCEIYLPADLASPGPQAVTYHRQVSRILQTHCVTCHRQDGSAPFALETYGEVSDFGKMISSVVTRGIMPPWFAEGPPPQNRDSSDELAETPGSQQMHWANERKLTSLERRELTQWVQAGMPEGDPADAPLAKEYPKDWEIGKPDLVLQIPDPVSVKATGQMDYVHRLITNPLPEDKWVSSLEIRPTVTAVVHHVLIYILKSRSGLREINDGEAGFLAAYVPGNSHQIYPEGYAKELPAGARLLFQIHYTPNGTATTDQTQLGLRFLDTPPRKQIKNRGIAKREIAIPPNNPNHKETTSLTVSRDVDLLAMMPHMHVRGKAFRYDLVYPDGMSTKLLHVPQYDFNWQLAYRLPEPLRIPAGSRIEVSAWYDNSSGNPANPAPQELVRWGKQSDEEMMLGYIEYIETDDNSTISSNEKNTASETGVKSISDSIRNSRLSGETPRRVVRTSIAMRLFERLDSDRNGTITKKELPQESVFNRLDSDGNGLITKEEVEQLRRQ